MLRIHALDISIIDSARNTTRAHFPPAMAPSVTPSALPVAALCALCVAASFAALASPAAAAGAGGGGVLGTYFPNWAQYRAAPYTFDAQDMQPIAGCAPRTRPPPPYTVHHTLTTQLLST